MSTLAPSALLSPARSRQRPWYPTSGVAAMPSDAGSTVQRNEAVANAPVPSVAVTVTVLVPGVVGVPVIVPLVCEIDVPAGRPVAEYDSVCPEVESLAVTGTDTAVPARPSCGPEAATVTGWPSCPEPTDRVPASGRLPSESPTSMP